MNVGTIRRARPANIKAFTLIELLVVIAIIAILAAILFPVFAKAREKARRATCVSNVKQLCTAIRMYADDNDETFVLSMNPGFNSISNQMWGGVLKKGEAARPLHPYTARNQDIFKCPDDNGTPGFCVRDWDPNVANSWLNSYVMNAITIMAGAGNIAGLEIGKAQANLTGAMPQPLKYPDVREPTRTILIGDHPMHCFWQGQTIAFKWHDPKDRPGFKTMGTVVGFVDGHAAYVTIQPYLDDPDGRWTFRPFGWKKPF